MRYKVDSLGLTTNWVCGECASSCRAVHFVLRTPSSSRPAIGGKRNIYFESQKPVSVHSELSTIQELFLIYDHTVS